MTIPVTRPQVGKIHALMAALGVHDRDEKLRILSAIVFRRIESSNDLTRAEASIAINMLDYIDKRDAPAEALAKLTGPGERYLASVTR